MAGKLCVIHHFKHGPMKISKYKIDFLFGRFVLQTSANLVEIFSKKFNLSKLTILRGDLSPDTIRYGNFFLLVMTISMGK
jgi:hypothetical protein